jgi:hypothetical protein
MFRGQMMWPIRDLTGETIAFGVRKLNPDERPGHVLHLARPRLKFMHSTRSATLQRASSSIAP